MTDKIKILLTADLFVQRRPGETDEQLRARASSLVLDIEQTVNGWPTARLHLWEVDPTPAEPVILDAGVAVGLVDIDPVDDAPADGAPADGAPAEGTQSKE